MTIAKTTRASDYSGKYFTKDDVIADGPFDLTITDIDERTFERRDGSGEQDLRLVLTFKEHRKQFPLNATNRATLQEAFGDLVYNWIGERIFLKHDPTVTFAGKRSGGVRIEIPADSKDDAA
ncbi:MAG: hypothetical protein QF634_02180 [Vicinamibacterales bacterium]|jgi:hypothetical protein|nr:hypothetical protein [Acidobacteriota bacterium]MDP6371299.1 hypothetical protein [Vicinamibacterales bacterium]|tara:strand:- start:1013 stop:1378 length:366 start_codon:yes stop_codon:yes gene_type:complete